MGSSIFLYFCLEHPSGRPPCLTHLPSKDTVATRASSKAKSSLAQPHSLSKHTYNPRTVIHRLRPSLGPTITLATSSTTTPPMHSLTHAPTHSLTHSPTHSPTHS